MKRCVRCDLSYEDKSQYCTKCGEKLLSDELIKHIQSPLDTSEEGLVKTLDYVVNVHGAMGCFEYLVKRVLDLRRIERENKDDIEWKTKISTEITLMNRIWTEELTDTYSLAIITNAPSGCAKIEFELAKLVVATKNFGENYILKWMAHEDIDGFKEANALFFEIIEGIKKVNQEGTRIVNSCNSLLQNS